VLYLAIMGQSSSISVGLALLFATLLTIFARPAQAAPVVAVRERTDIELAPVTRVDNNVYVRGTVRERSTGRGAQYVVLNITVDGRPTQVLTDADGEFSVFVPVSQGQHQLAVRFSGDSSYEGTDLELNNFDIDRQPLALSIEVSNEVDQAEDSVEVKVEAETAGQAIPISVKLRVSEADGEGKLLGTHELHTGKAGQASVKIPTSELGKPGRKQLTASYPGDAGLDPAEATRTFTLRTKSQLSLELPDHEIDYGDEVTARGRLLDSRGEGIVGAFVTLEIGSQDVADATTDERGDFVLSVDSEELGSGTVTMQAVYAGQSAYSPARSTPLSATIGEKQPVPVAYTLAAFSATCFALLSFVALRTRPWERWMHKGDDEQEDESDGEGLAPEIPETGLQASRPSLVSSIRRAADHGFDGIVVDAISGKPAGFAQIVLEGPGETIRVTCDDRGRFSQDDIRAGTWSATARARGFVSEHFSAAFPHRGELRGSKIRLLPVREKIFAMYRAVAQSLLPSPDLWGIWTPRQIFEHVRESGPNPALSELTDFVEEIYFSQRIPDESAIEVAAGKIADAGREAGLGGD
jgi:hypothetical protein